MSAQFVQFGAVLVALAMLMQSCEAVETFEVEAIDTEAMTRCQQLHNAPADNNSVFTNDFCLLNCFIAKKLTPHPLNEGLRCPLASSESFICKGGNCLEKIVNGKVSLEILSATLSAKLNAYATACVVNSQEKLTLPIQDRSHCVNCLTTIAPNGLNPVWNMACAALLPLTFSHQSIIYLEVWDHHGQLNNNFVGGVTQALPQNSDHSALQKDLTFPLVGGPLTGNIVVHYTWTPV